MGTRKKTTPLAAALLAVDALSPEETQTILDYLHGKIPKAPRKKKEKTEKAEKKGPQLLPGSPAFGEGQKAS